MKVISYNVSYEKMITRLPGLFAYLEADEFGNMTLHKATDNLNGCYGKIIQNIMLPDDVNLTVGEETLLMSGQEYTFRTLISYYYQYRDKIEETDSFKAFIEKGIGKISVDDEITEKYIETPSFIYLSEVKRLYNEMVKLSKMCDFYERLKEKGIPLEEYMCCEINHFNNLGGKAEDGFMSFLRNKISEAENLANEYFRYASNIENGMRLDFDVDLCSTSNDLGIMDCYIQEWMPYRKYFVGDKVFFDGKIWVCNRNNSGEYDEVTQKVIFPTDYFDVDNKSAEDTIDIEGQTDSKIKDLRRIATYENLNDVAEVPEEGRDWLFYYRTKQTYYNSEGSPSTSQKILNISTMNDVFGNILSLSNAKNNISTPATGNDDLLAYGDFIESIDCDKGNRIITFKYHQGAHLKSNDDPVINYDDDGNPIYKWKDLVWDEDEKVGIVYTEQFYYEDGGELDDLIKENIKVYVNNETNDIITEEEWQSLPSEEQDNYTVKVYKFDKYINGEYDKELKHYKFEFITSNNSISYVKTVSNQDALIKENLADFNRIRSDYDEFMESALIRRDYFNGITYAPTKEINVKIDRGSTSAFQKHIAFGEIKTLEDMLEYQNESFFRITNV